MPRNKATLSARFCQIEATKIVPLTSNQRTECSIFKRLFLIRFKTKTKRAKLKKMIIIFALSGMIRVHQSLVAEKHGINRE